MEKTTEETFVARGAIVAGDVTFGTDCSVWYNAVIRGDDAPIRIGERSNVQDCAVLHADPGQPLVIGNDVTIGHGAIVHCERIGDGTLIGMGAIVLGGACIGCNCIVGAGSLVTQGTRIPDGMVAFGNPAKVRRPTTQEEQAANLRNAACYVEHARMA